MRFQGLGFHQIEQSYWMRALIRTHRPLDKGPRPKSDNSRLNLHVTILEVKSISLNPRKQLTRRAHGLKNQDASQGPTQVFNLFQMSPNWLLGIWILDPSTIFCFIIFNGRGSRFNNYY
jgi:hypothetical protein